MRYRLKTDRLAEALTRRPISLNAWANRLGLAPGHLSDLVNGRRRYPNSRTRKRLLEGLALEQQELFEVELRGAGRLLRPPSREAPKSGARRKVGFDDQGAPRPRTRSRSDTSMGRFASKSRRSIAGLTHEIACALRFLVRNPSLATTVVVALGFGLAANLAIYATVRGTALAPLPFANAEALVNLHTTDPASGQTRGNFSYPMALDLAERLSPSLDIAIYDYEPFAVAGGDRPLRLEGVRVSPRFFEVLGVEPLLGRTFAQLSQDELATALVLNEGVWRNHFGADPGIVGRQVLLDGEPAVVVGIVKRDVEFPNLAQMFVPLRLDLSRESRDSSWLDVVARIDRGLARESAQSRLDEVAAAIATEYPETNEGVGIRAVGLREDFFGDMSQMFRLMQVGVAFFLLVVCLNATNLLFASALHRRGEIVLRRALGASTRQLARQLLVETLLMTTAALVLGAALSPLALRGIRRLFPPEIPVWIEPRLDLAVFSYGAALAGVGVLLAGLAPASFAARSSFAGTSTLGTLGSTRSTQTIGLRRLRSALVVSAVAMTVVLAAGAGLMVHSVLRLAGTDPGFETDGAIIVGLDLLAYRHDEAARGRLTRRYAEAFEALPGVTAVGSTMSLPLGRRTWRSSFYAETPGEGAHAGSAILNISTPGLIAALGLPLLEGQYLQEIPLETSSAQQLADADIDPRLREVLVSRSIAEDVWPDQSAIGQRIRLGDPEEGDTYRVRGVVGDVRHRGLDREPSGGLYMIENAYSLSRTTWVVRTDQSEPALIESVRRAVHEIDPNQPLHALDTLASHVARSWMNWRAIATLSWILAVSSVLAAAMGLYGLLSHTVSSRRLELGVRVALGATGRGVRRIVLGYALRIVAMGAALGLPVSFVLARAVAGTLYGVTPVDPVAILVLTLALLALVALAAAQPAAAAARADPLQALRGD